MKKNAISNALEKRIAGRIAYGQNSGRHGPFSLHVVGLGKTGAGVVRALLRGPLANYLKEDGSRFTALVVDIGEQDLQGLEALAGGLPADKIQIRTRALQVPNRNDLFATLQRYREFLKREYPRYYWNPNFDPWIPVDQDLPSPGESFPRGVAKAIYGKAYYDDGILEQDMKEFAQSVRDSELSPLVFIVFSLGGGTGSGMVVDFARHLSNVKLGRSVPVVGIGVLPCSGDPLENRDGNLFAVMNEIDLMNDENKNKGVTAVWGDLYDVPFTGGFIMVSQEPAWQATNDIRLTNDIIDDAIASFITRESGFHAWDTLAFSGWLNNPTENWPPMTTNMTAGNNWINLLTVLRPDEKIDKWLDKKGSLNGIKKGFKADYMGIHVKGLKSAASDSLENKLKNTFSEFADNVAVSYGDGESQEIEVLLPQLSKVDLSLYSEAKAKYNEKDDTEKLLMHSILLDLGVMVSEPSIRFEGQAGECIWGCACWIAVPHELVGGAG